MVYLVYYLALLIVYLVYCLALLLFIRKNTVQFTLLMHKRVQFKDFQRNKKIIPRKFHVLSQIPH